MRNDLEEFSKYSWIEPQPNVLVFETKDETEIDYTENEADAFDNSQDAVPVFSAYAEIGSNIYETWATDDICIVSDTVSDTNIMTVLPGTVSDTDEATVPQDSYVWIPKSGKKYHNNAKCSNMSGPSKVTVNEAEELGFTKCKRCY